MPSGEQEIEHVGAARVTAIRHVTLVRLKPDTTYVGGCHAAYVVSAFRRTWCLLEPRPILGDGCPRSIRGGAQAVRKCAVDVLGGHPLRDAVAEQDAGALTLAQTFE